MQIRHPYGQSGPDHCGDTELLALVLGGRAGLSLAADLLSRFGSLDGLAEAPPQAIADVQGIGAHRAVRVHAALQAGRRSLKRPAPLSLVRTPEDAWRMLGPCLRGLRDEELHALFLDRRRQALAQRMLTRGTDGFTVVDPRQVFRPAVAMGASAVILAHNHPSGDPSPSAQDRDVTRRVASAGRILGVQLLDHLVITDDRWVSMAEQGELPAWRPEPASWVADSPCLGTSPIPVVG